MADQTHQTNDTSDSAGLTNGAGSSVPGALSAAQLVQNYGQLPEDGNVEAVRRHLICWMLQLTFTAGLYG